ncbi:MAG: alanine--glyoxylate aminotransferase family protein [Gemmatimonadetes bacterium]|nr:alanine--glyoxylate aminotransferase family protein [Gemmatimonadota bacterium]MBK6778931.1 alanine--glyoxylate aminotransferase family protein [Gemmatimonadota bacterium]MBK7348758.1 alanine--glyoxylate aminotransferase family protein [Gemmatimonadota bacterium]MBK7714324.1 alanine--glyoxylate aminotransferase family protein [Gemmatimonadota bacterium]MBK7783387.1 alanine--glyoxylate aminotransferase family protein [Gemmatimonadota bacterium]
MTAVPAAPPTFGRFFLPGPTEVRPEILAAQARPMIGHRGKGMEQLIAQMMPGLQRIFRTQRPVYISSSSATGLMEASIRNCGGRRVLSLVNGAFSERFYKIALANGVEATPLEVPLGEVHRPEQLRAALAAGRYDAITVVHSETSTGALNPIADLARVAHEAGDVLLLVDSVTGVAGARVETDAWDLDFVLTGSQKALALPPGLALGVAHPRAVDRARKASHRGIYFDLVEFESFILKHQTPNTPALSLMYALAAQVARIEAETIEARWARHAAMAERTWAWAAEMHGRGVDMRVLAPEGFRSPTVTCLTVPAGKTGSAVNEAMKARGYTISAGYGALKDQTIRIGHMGDHTVAELDALLAVLAEVVSA